MAHLTVDDIRAAEDLPREVVEVPEWGGTVVVQGLSVEGWVALSRDRQRRADLSEEKNSALDALLFGVVEPKFSADDAAWLAKKSLAAVGPIIKVFNRLSGFDPQALAEARKNSSATAGEGSSSDSPETSAGPSPS